MGYQLLSPSWKLDLQRQYRYIKKTIKKKLKHWKQICNFLYLCSNIDTMHVWFFYSFILSNEKKKVGFRPIIVKLSTITNPLTPFQYWDEVYIYIIIPWLPLLIFSVNRKWTGLITRFPTCNIWQGYQKRLLFRSVTVYNEKLSSQCNLPAQIEQV